MNGSERFPTLVRALEEGFGSGRHSGVQAYVSRFGETLADFALGEARRGLPMAADHLVLWQSATKPIVAVAAARLWERGALDWDDPVARFIPEFGANGKGSVTLRHILTHTAGFRFVMLGWSSQTWEENFRRLCAAPLEPGWTPGRKAGYHPATSWFILAEVLRRLDGRPVEQQLREDIFAPLDMEDSWLAMPPERFFAYDTRIAPLYNTSNGDESQLELVDEEAGATIPRPGASGRGPIRELARFYEMLLLRGALGGVRILSPQAVEALTARHRVGLFDHTFQAVVDWGLGFIVNSEQYGARNFPYGFGPYASPRTFGHGGHQSCVSYCDPENGVVVAIWANGLPGEQAHNRRFRAINEAVYEDLGLAT